MSQKTVISMAFPTELLKQIDVLAKAEYTSRSEFIRRALLRATNVRKNADEEAAWGELLAVSDQRSAEVRSAGYRTDADFTRLAAEMRQARKAAKRD